MARDIDSLNLPGVIIGICVVGEYGLKTCFFSGLQLTPNELVSDLRPRTEMYKAQSKSKPLEIVLTFNTGAKIKMSFDPEKFEILPEKH